MNTCQVCEYLESTISKVLTWQIIATLNRKLLEKQKVQNHFAFYEVHIGHFFYNVKTTVSFGNLSVFRFKDFSPDKLTNKLTEGQNQLLNPFAHVRGG